MIATNAPIDLWRHAPPSAFPAVSHASPSHSPEPCSTQAQCGYSQPRSYLDQVSSFFFALLICHCVCFRRWRSPFYACVALTNARVPKFELTLFRGFRIEDSLSFEVRLYGDVPGFVEFSFHGAFYFLAASEVSAGSLTSLRQHKRHFTFESVLGLLRRCGP